MKKYFLLFSFLFFSSQSYAAELNSFLQACGYGTLIGAGVGVVTLAFEKNPSDHANNIARGASLGLYGGIVYGLLEAQEKRLKHEVVLMSGDLRGFFYTYNY